MARDGVLYSEQSQSVNKLSKGAFPKDMTDRVLAEVNAQRASRGEPPIDVRFLAMIETRLFGEAGLDTTGSAKDWKAQLDAAQAVVARGDVIGIDVAGPETTSMTAGGEQAVARFRDLAHMLEVEGKKAGRNLLLRPHVGEGYVEMPKDPKTGLEMPFDRDNNGAHYEKANQNLQALVRAVDAMTKTGPNGEAPVYDPQNPTLDVRFGHVTHLTPEIVADITRLGIASELLLGSNAVSGSLQDNPAHPAGRDSNGHLQSFDDHSLLMLASQGATIILGTDSQAVMGTGMRREYQTAARVIERFRGEPSNDKRGRRKVEVTEATYFEARRDADPATAKPPYELRYDELPIAMKRNIDEAHTKMLATATGRHIDIRRGDLHDARRKSRGDDQ